MIPAPLLFPNVSNVNSQSFTPDRLCQYSVHISVNQLHTITKRICAEVIFFLWRCKDLREFQQSFCFPLSSHLFPDWKSKHTPRDLIMHNFGFTFKGEIVWGDSKNDLSFL